MSNQHNTDVPVLERVQRALLSFRESEGRHPNVLIAGPNAEVELYRYAIRPGATYLGMTVLTSDDEDDLSVAYRSKT